MTEFEKVYRKNRNVWLKTLNKIIGNTADAEDILQDALCIAIRDIAKYDPTRGSYNTWFTQVMFSQLSGWFRKNKKNSKNIPLEWYDEAIDYSFITENKCIMHQKILSLSSQLDQKIVTLTYVYGYKMEDVSSILKVSEGKISTTNSKFRQLLKEN